ncbi:MAG TPA: peroxidase-related enzyme [Vicinamibacterales bacterium]|nr:peroxidase-related enzyme [Vicinamibacterales bacterium]
MAHIKLQDGLPGIRGLFAFRPETAAPMSELADILLFGDHTLTRAERELIAAYVSALNECVYCRNSHAAIAACLLGGNDEAVAAALRDPETADLSPKMKALLAIAGRVQQSGRHVSGEDVARARAAGATDLEIHDTVLIAAFFCLCNRYVDGLATWTPEDPAGYRERAAFVAREGYAGVLRRVAGATVRGDRG